MGDMAGSTPSLQSTGRPMAGRRRYSTARTPACQWGLESRGSPRRQRPAPLPQAEHAHPEVHRQHRAEKINPLGEKQGDGNQVRQDGDVPVLDQLLSSRETARPGPSVGTRASPRWGAASCRRHRARGLAPALRGRRPVANAGGASRCVARETGQRTSAPDPRAATSTSRRRPGSTYRSCMPMEPYRREWKNRAAKSRLPAMPTGQFHRLSSAVSQTPQAPASTPSISVGLTGSHPRQDATRQRRRGHGGERLIPMHVSSPLLVSPGRKKVGACSMLQAPTSGLAHINLLFTRWRSRRARRSGCGWLPKRG